MASASRIKTTVVGSYPMPDWLQALPSEQALIDATRVVIDIQEQAGIDLVCDGELSRFDVNHPETNGMIEYFVRPMEGIRTAVTFEDLVVYRAQPGRGSPSPKPPPGGMRTAPAPPARAAGSGRAPATCHRPARGPSDLHRGRSSSP